MHRLFPVAGQTLKDRPACWVGEGSEYVIGIGRRHRKTITKWLLFVKRAETIFLSRLAGYWPLLKKIIFGFRFESKNEKGQGS